MIWAVALIMILIILVAPIYVVKEITVVSVILIIAGGYLGTRMH